MAPFDDQDPRSSWEHCKARECKQLFEGRIWKCAPLAYLRKQNEKHHLSPAWSPYLAYEPLGPECSDSELADFLATEEEWYCGMCPAAPTHFEKPLPFPPTKGGNL